MKGQHPPVMPGLDERRGLFLQEFEGTYSDKLISVVARMCEHDAANRYPTLVDAVNDFGRRVTRSETQIVDVDPKGEIVEYEKEARKQKRVMIKSLAGTGIIDFIEDKLTPNC